MVLISSTEAQNTSENKVQTKVLAMDFSKLTDATQWSRFKSEIEHLDVGVLSEFIDLFMSVPLTFG